MRCLFMNRKKTLIILVAVAFSLVLLLIHNTFFIDKEYLDIECTSIYKRNTKINHNFYYHGLFSLALHHDGTGELTIEAKSDEPAGYNAYRLFNFDYYIDKSSHIYAKNAVVSKNANDNVSDDFFKKYFFDLAFDGKGQIKIFRFRNTYVFSSPTILIDTCV